jgi:hypothetical protein
LASARRRGRAPQVISGQTGDRHIFDINRLEAGARGPGPNGAVLGDAAGRCDRIVAREFAKHLVCFA